MIVKKIISATMILKIDRYLETLKYQKFDKYIKMKGVFFTNVEFHHSYLTLATSHEPCIVAFNFNIRKKKYGLICIY